MSIAMLPADAGAKGSMNTSDRSMDAGEVVVARSPIFLRSRWQVVQQ
jgi:hypothetical protein